MENRMIKVFFFVYHLLSDANAREILPWNLVMPELFCQTKIPQQRGRRNKLNRLMLWYTSWEKTGAYLVTRCYYVTSPFLLNVSFNFHPKTLGEDSQPTFIANPFRCSANFIRTENTQNPQGSDLVGFSNPRPSRAICQKLWRLLKCEPDETNDQSEG